jgi:hypothetical protein
MKNSKKKNYMFKETPITMILVWGCEEDNGDFAGDLLDYLIEHEPNLSFPVEFHRDQKDYVIVKAYDKENFANSLEGDMKFYFTDRKETANYYIFRLNEERQRVFIGIVE